MSMSLLAGVPISDSAITAAYAAAYDRLKAKGYPITDSGARPESSRVGDGAGERGIIGPSAESAVPSILSTRIIS